jgi:hypothetical protein
MENLATHHCQLGTFFRGPPASGSRYQFLSVCAATTVEQWTDSVDSMATFWKGDISAWHRESGTYWYDFCTRPTRTASGVLAKDF